jgi:hypothetical protein
MSQRSFANPIHSILYLDVTGDGVKEFVILTLRGVHIMQVSSVLFLLQLGTFIQNIYEL